MTTKLTREHTRPPLLLRTVCLIKSKRHKNLAGSCIFSMCGHSVQEAPSNLWLGNKALWARDRIQHGRWGWLISRVLIFLISPYTTDICFWMRKRVLCLDSAKLGLGTASLSLSQVLSTQPPLCQMLQSAMPNTLLLISVLFCSTFHLYRTKGKCFSSSPLSAETSWHYFV